MIKRRKSRFLTAGMAAVLCTALLLSGTFAWSSLKQVALNEMAGKPGNPGGRLHDDFDGSNKDIYVENYTGYSDGQPIIVRVRLRTYEAVGAAKVAEVKEKTAGWESSWEVFNPNETDGTYGYGHWEWEMGGQTTYLPTFNQNNKNDDSDVMGTYAQGFEDYDADKKVEGKTFSGTEVTADNPQGTSAVHTVQKTLEGKVYTLAQWEAYKQQTGKTTEECWVYGDDGWAYWAAPLNPKTATAPLLNSIRLKNALTDEWYYGIYVESQMVTADEIGEEAKEAKSGFYCNHAADENGKCKSCQGECPSETMEALLEAIAEKCVSSGTGGASLTQLTEEEQRQAECIAIYETMLEEEAAEKEKSEEEPEEDTDKEEDSSLEDEADTEEKEDSGASDETPPEPEEAEPPQEPETENPPEEEEADTALPSEEETTSAEGSDETQKQ